MPPRPDVSEQRTAQIIEAAIAVFTKVPPLLIGSSKEVVQNREVAEAPTDVTHGALAGEPVV